jgi:hypothetical protein
MIARVTALVEARTKAYTSLKGWKVLGLGNPMAQRWTMLENTFEGAGRSTGLRDHEREDLPHDKDALATTQPFSSEAEIRRGTPGAEERGPDTGARI